MERIKNLILTSGNFGRLCESVGRLSVGERLAMQGVAGSMLAFVAAAIMAGRNTQILLIASDVDKAEKLRDDCALLMGEGSVRFFGARPIHKAQSLDMSASIAQIETLKSLSSSAHVVIVASPQAMVEKVPPRARFQESVIEVTVAGEYPFQKLIGRLERDGFERKSFVEGYGDFAVRGGIIDVFPYVGENPLRMEFWGDRVESIREFDLLSQRSIRELQSASIVPALSTDLTDSSNPAQARTTDSSDKKLSASLFDYLQTDAIVILDEPAIIEREIDELFAEGAPNLFTYGEIFEQSGSFVQIFSTMFETQRSAIDFHSTPQPSINASIKELTRTMEKLRDDGYTIFLTSDHEQESKRLKELIEEVDTGELRSESVEQREESRDDGDRRPRLQPIFLAETIHSGFVYPQARLALFTEHEIFGRLKRRGTAKRRRFKGFTPKELQQLHHGDHVVHVDHGIGVFDGLKKIKVGGIEQEVIKLSFLEEDVLYVNLNFINRVQKYSSQEGHVPKLNKLGGGEWEKAKARAKRRIKDIARDIISLYARRKKEQGHNFAPDTHWQKELEASFMYEDTIDQATATMDIKQDMESSSPMDRLICGDVGFGKTEVAVRAAFKAVMGGKQVAVLVPTTILALQHYNTFQDRLQRYTTRVENITRFKSSKEQKEIVEGLKRGSVDIVIGTHRLLSKDIAFKDLGLLIIDEEHRFGVGAKEKLRQIKISVDTLALTATPIPRTLHFSLIGARDLSLITTPPRNRIPIMTEIIPADGKGRAMQWSVIREAVVRELHRAGQIYFVHDRVSNIDAVAEQMKRHVPEARVHIAHGQMSGHDLERTMVEFLEKKYDVLVCTKIIESGLDIPNVNTIIINRADMFGLAELYQLRGRVGRSNVQAYAYLLTPPLSVMPKASLRRLQAIEEFTELGSGFNLAMRDLEIRGAGNLLGGEQSGFIMEMGFEMYERIVRESVEELRAQEFKEVFESRQPTSHIAHPTSTETLIDTDIEALIPALYIESDGERLDVYRRLYKVATPEEIHSMRAELRDRFGEYPEEVENLLQIIELRLAASRAGFPKVSLTKGTLRITMPDESNIDFYGTVENVDVPFQRMMKKISGGILKDAMLKQEGKELTLRLSLPTDDIISDRIEGAKRAIAELLV